MLPPMIFAAIYLFLAILLLLATLGAYRPGIYGVWLAPVGALASLILMLGWPLFVGLGLWITGVVVYLGGLGHPAGLLGLLLHLIAWALMARYQMQTYRALPVLDGAEVADVDHPFTSRLTEEERRQLRAGRVSFRPSLTMKIPAMADVECIPNIIFREVDGVRLRLDVYRPRNPRGPLPVAVYIHGGGWILGSRRQSRFMMYELAAAGWAVFAISYRFAPRFPLPAAIHDCKAALAWVRAHAHEYGGVGEDLVVIGGSAGGHLASMMALTAGDPRFQPGFEEADTRVRGAVVLYGVSDFDSLFAEAPRSGAAIFLQQVVFKARYSKDPAPFRLVQPTSHLPHEVPPVLLVHGRNDGLVPLIQSRRLYDVLRKSGATQVHLLELPYALHAFEIVPSPLHQRAVRVIVLFMDSLRKRS